MGDFLSALLPASADNTVPGMKLPVYVFALIAVVSTVRSLIHLLAPDGGAGSIAGMDLNVAGANGIVFAFALWGSSQFIYALIQLAVVFRYRSLIPFMYVLLILEALLRMLVGRMKPVVFAHTPPGAIGNWVILPLAAVMLVLCLRREHVAVAARDTP
ncbi:MAG TPA: hypothetical protein VMH05_26080 [Bryobacteraceae bacterium]|nr:hypothetical protein [Bryobacteraceae bacterium]